MNREREREMIEQQEPQPGMDWFYRCWNAGSGVSEGLTLRDRLHARAIAIEAGDRVTAQLLRAAADQLGAERAALAEARQLIFRLQTNAACCRTSPAATTRDGEAPFEPEAL